MSLLLPKARNCPPYKLKFKINLMQGSLMVSHFILKFYSPLVKATCPFLCCPHPDCFHPFPLPCVYMVYVSFCLLRVRLVLLCAIVLTKIASICSMPLFVRFLYFSLILCQALVLFVGFLSYECFFAY